MERILSLLETARTSGLQAPEVTTAWMQVLFLRGPRREYRDYLEGI